MREDIANRLNEVFRDVFDDDTITVTDSTTAADIEGWDSLMHISLIGTIEDEFEIRFNMKDILGLKNVGELAKAIEKYLHD